MPVGAILPAGVLCLFRVTLDYAGPSLSLTQPAETPGVAVAMSVNEGTGLIRAEVGVDLQACGYGSVRVASLSAWQVIGERWPRPECSSAGFYEPSM